MQKERLLLTAFLWSLIACNVNQTKVNPDAPESMKPVKKQLTFSLTDSLIKYENTDSVLLVDDLSSSILFIGHTNNYSYAIWIPDSVLIFFQHTTSKEWVATDRFPYKSSFSFSSQTDINGDGYKDIIISSLSGSSGNTENKVFIFNNNLHAFRHNPSYDLPNVEYDSKGKFIKSWWFSSTAHCQDKWLYKINGDSLILHEAVSYCPVENTHGKFAILEFSKWSGNKYIAIKTSRGASYKLYKVFEKSLWHTQ